MDANPKRKLECPKCSKMFKHQSHFDRHIVTHDPDAKVKCEKCGKILKNPLTLSCHIKRLHANQQRPICDICHRMFSSPTYLRIHIDTVHSTKVRPRPPCTFPGCEKTYLDKGGVLTHVKTEHVENPVRLTCTLCGKQFKKTEYLSGHIATHTTEKTHKCATCGKSFGTSFNLRRHEKTHLEKSNRAMFQCQICPMTFLTRSSLKFHIQFSHDNERNHACTLCHKRFGAPYHLKRHVEAEHPTSKNLIHSCDKCEYKSHSKYYLAQHVRRHNIKRLRFKCYFCAREFVACKAFVRHCS